MKTTFTLFLLVIAYFSGNAQETKNEISIELISRYSSPTSKKAETTASSFYPTSGLMYTRHLPKFSLFSRYNRYHSSDNRLAVWGPNKGTSKPLSHKETSFQIGIAKKPSIVSTFSPLVSVSINAGQAKTNNYEDPRYSEQYFYGKPAQRNIKYLGLNSSLGMRYNVNDLFHIDLSTELGFVKTKGNYYVFHDHDTNPALFSFSESAIVPTLTLAKLSIGVNF